MWITVCCCVCICVRTFSRNVTLAQKPTIRFVFRLSGHININNIYIEEEEEEKNEKKPSSNYFVGHCKKNCVWSTTIQSWYLIWCAYCNVIQEVAPSTCVCVCVYACILQSAGQKQTVTPLQNSNFILLCITMRNIEGEVKWREEKKIRNDQTTAPKSMPMCHQIWRKEKPRKEIHKQNVTSHKTNI